MALATRELIDAALAAELIDPAGLEEALAQARRQGADPLEIVAARGRFPAAAFYRAFAERRGLPFLDLERTPPSTELARKLPETLVRRQRLVPVEGDSGQVFIATANPDDRSTFEAVGRILRRSVTPALADPAQLGAAIDAALAEGGGPPAVGDDAVALLDRVLHEAYLRRASDIHLDPQASGLRIRFRVDGRLADYRRGLSAALRGALVGRVKVLAGLDIAESRAPQDGGFSQRLGGPDGADIDIRVATAPTRWGERATLRLLGSQTKDLTLEALGMEQTDLARFREAIRRPHGMVLLTGPTGSGKTTTLYAAIREILKPELNILTVEDPIEYLIDGVGQVQVGASEKVSFASALRSLLRHDPDVLMVGEIRDRETADVALKAAMTGHLVLSTLHASSACGAVTRLADIGCEPYLVGATLSAVVAQRLVRRLCRRCSRQTEGGQEGTGCAACLGTGFRGRIGLFETLWLDAELGLLVAEGANEEALRRAAGPRLTTLADDGWRKVEAGLTTAGEVRRAVWSEGGPGR
ncbi:MAG: type II/IV secretion system protein [Planctomycetes bacterium]|nr:type II/IV secretion system protein [Planctomycetota bacterium]